MVPNHIGDRSLLVMIRVAANITGEENNKPGSSQCGVCIYISKASGNHLVSTLLTIKVPSALNVAATAKIAFRSMVLPQPLI